MAWLLLRLGRYAAPVLGKILNDASSIAVLGNGRADLHSMNAAIRSLPVQIQVDPIHTRTIAGFNYSFNLPSGTAVALTNITYASYSFKNQLGIKGHATLSSGEVLNLACQQL